jgi:pimeloyl-ACP methyl ester carboxylesterase
MMRFLVSLAAIFVVGCGLTKPVSPMHYPQGSLERDPSGLLLNPSFPISIEEARTRLKATESDKRQLDRPLVICGGFMDFGLGPWLMKRKLDRHVSGKIILVSFATCGSFQGCRERLVRRIDAELGVDGSQATKEVDVIGQSMGGLIALHAAVEDPALGKRVKINRLVTICSPLQGAKLAEATSFDVFRYQRDMRPGSSFYAWIAKASPDCEIISYARLRDDKVGEEYAAPVDRLAWWVDTPKSEDAHDRADFDPRIILDIVLRLRGETPITKSPPAPLPATRAAESS